MMMSPVQLLYDKILSKVGKMFDLIKSSKAHSKKNQSKKG